MYFLSTEMDTEVVTDFQEFIEIMFMSCEVMNTMAFISQVKDFECYLISRLQVLFMVF
jgi:hypothetical protein